MVTERKYFDIQRKIVAHITGDSWREAPHCTFTYEADAGEMLDELKKLNSLRPKERKITVNTLVSKIITEGLKEAPELNSHIIYSRKSVSGTITQFGNIDISMPMIMPDGKMMTVTMADFDKKNISNFKKILDDYSKFKVRNYELAKYDLITFLSGLSILRSMHFNRLDGGYLRINYLLAKQYPKFSSKFDNLFICSVLMKYSFRNIL